MENDTGNIDTKDVCLSSMLIIISFTYSRKQIRCTVSEMVFISQNMHNYGEHVTLVKKC